MSKEFIEQRTGADSLDVAVRQHKQLAYFTTSQVQKDLTTSYLEAWAERKYNTDNHFLSWVKNVFKTENFISFFKYYREPNAAAKLINNRIKGPLKRVFYAEDAYFKYVIRDEETEEPIELADGFESRLFDAVLFRHNDIIIHDLEDVNKPVRDILEIDKVKAIESKNNDIKRIAYSAKITLPDNEEPTAGYIYLDDERFMFYNTDYTVLVDESHDLGYCPAFYLSTESFGDDDIVRASIFSYVRADLEEYVFLKTLQRMTEPNGAIPIVAKLKTKEDKKDGKESGNVPQHPMSAATITGKQSKDVRSDVTPGSSPFQAGSIIDLPLIRKTGGDGSIDTTLVQEFVKFHYTPIEPLTYLDDRIKDIEQSIIVSLLGDYSEANESAKNEMQVSKSFVSKEDKLRDLSLILSYSREKSDKTMLSLAYGPDAVTVDCFYGSDFFLASEKDMYELYKLAPNAIERRSVLTRVTQARNRFNRSKARREAIKYKILPYPSDTDFYKAVENQLVDPVMFQLQTRFDHWVMMFEAMYGDVLAFWDSMEDAPESNKLKVILDLLTDLIKNNTKENGNTEQNSTS